MRRLAERIGFPLGAIATVAGGLLLTLAIAVVADPDEGGEFLSYAATEEIPDSAAAELPGGASIQIVDAGLAATRPNGSEYRLFRVDGTLHLTGDPAPRRVECTVVVGEPTLLARSITERRATYPRPSGDEDVTLQNVPGAVVLQFSAKGVSAIAVELDDAFTEYSSVAGTVVDWIKYDSGRQGLWWELPADTTEADLSFAAFWRTTANPAAKIVCARFDDPEGPKTKTSGELTAAELEAAEEGEDEDG